MKEKILYCTNINNDPAGLHTYYDKRSCEFVAMPLKKNPGKHLVLAPCTYNYTALIWRRFYASLTPEELEVAKAYPFRKGYFNYLREEGLIDTYTDVKDTIMDEVFQNWLNKNGIQL